MHAKRGAYTEQGLLHVQSHLVIIQAHDLDETFKSPDLDKYIRVLGGLANDLHDVVTFTLYPISLDRIKNRKGKRRTSRSKLSLTNSKELYRAWMAAS
jgi:hypothetical protein